MTTQQWNELSSEHVSFLEHKNFWNTKTRPKTSWKCRHNMVQYECSFLPKRGKNICGQLRLHPHTFLNKCWTIYNWHKIQHSHLTRFIKTEKNAPRRPRSSEVTWCFFSYQQPDICQFVLYEACPFSSFLVTSVTARPIWSTAVSHVFLRSTSAFLMASKNQTHKTKCICIEIKKTL
jgi:hypothetical protein